jgi:hypothetical protein
MFSREVDIQARQSLFGIKGETIISDVGSQDPSGESFISELGNLEFRVGVVSSPKRDRLCT